MQKERTTRTAPLEAYKNTVYSNSWNYYTKTGEETQPANETSINKPEKNSAWKARRFPYAAEAPAHGRETRVVAEDEPSAGVCAGRDPAAARVPRLVGARRGGYKMRGSA
jgi:hypothetical protein